MLVPSRRFSEGFEGSVACTGSVIEVQPLSVAEPAAEMDVAQIHLQHADFVWRSLQRLGVRARDLEDALQEVFVVVHRRRHTFDGSARMTSWLFGICLRVAAAHRRRAHVRRELVSVSGEDELAEEPGASPEAQAIARQDRARLDAVLDRLELGRRAVFVMFEIEGMSAAQIAEVLGIPLGTVYSRLSAARADFSNVASRLRKRDARGARA